MSNPFRVPNLAEKNQSTRYYSDRQEKAVAKAVGGNQTKNSGATLFGGKSDVHTSQGSIECKTRTKNCDSISIKKEGLSKLKKEKIADQKRFGALSISFGPDSPNYYLIEESTFQLFLDLLTNFYEQ